MVLSVSAHTYNPLEKSTDDHHALEDHTNTTFVKVKSYEFKKMDAGTYSVNHHLSSDAVYYIFYRLHLRNDTKMCTQKAGCKKKTTTKKSSPGVKRAKVMHDENYKVHLFHELYLLKRLLPFYCSGQCITKTRDTHVQIVKQT